jgi:predicted AAA+ superfamily ATPase
VAQGYQRRIVDDELDALLPSLPAIALEGAKGVGKTASAQQRATIAFLLDDPGTRQLTEADPQRIAKAPATVLVDEWQRLPQVWDIVRRAVDSDPSPGRFLLTGSASPATPGTHSGAGRIVQLRMRPMALAERGTATTVSLAELLTGAQPTIQGASPYGLDEYVNEIVTGGFPALRDLEGRALRAQLDAYLARAVDHDFPEQGVFVRKPHLLRAWMQAYAAATSSTASFETLRDAATSGEGDKPAKETTMTYRETLQRLWLIDPVLAWLPTRNHLKRLSSAPKHHVVDPALAARLLGAGPGALLSGASSKLRVPRDGTLLGALFESLMVLSIRVYAQAAEGRIGHLRTRGGDREIDIIVERDDGKVVAIEVKLAATVNDGDVRHLRWLKSQIGDDLLDAVVVTTGQDAYRRKDGVAVVPAALLGP